MALGERDKEEEGQGQSNWKRRARATWRLATAAAAADPGALAGSWNRVGGRFGTAIGRSYTGRAAPCSVSRAGLIGTRDGG